MEINHIKVFAALEDGGLVWAKNFFEATSQDEIKLILQRAGELFNEKEELEAVQKIYDDYYTANPNGNRFPIVKWAEFDFMEKVLKGSSWHGIMDLTNPVQFGNFIRYVS